MKNIMVFLVFRIRDFSRSGKKETLVKWADKGPSGLEIFLSYWSSCNRIWNNFPVTLDPLPLCRPIQSHPFLHFNSISIFLCSLLYAFVLFASFSCIPFHCMLIKLFLKKWDRTHLLGGLWCLAYSWGLSKISEVCSAF